MMVLILGGAIMRTLQHSLARVIPELQGFCPIGAVQVLFRIAADPSSLVRPDRSHLWVISGVLLITLLFGAVFCSYLCPLGSLQEWIGRAGKRLLKKKFNRPVPKQVDTALGTLRYLFIGLIGLTVFGVISFNLDIINPSSALVHLWVSAVTPAAMVLLAVTASLSLFYDRPWCRWICPYGVILGFLGKISVFKLRRSRTLCISCGRCDRSCHARIAVSEADEVTDCRCIRCGRCTASCPVEGALLTTGPRREAAAAVLIPVLFFTPLAAAQASGLYVSPSAQQSAPAAFDPESISPVISVGELARLMGIEYHELTGLLELAPDFDEETLLFDIEEQPEYEHITVGYVRSRVIHYIGQED